MDDREHRILIEKLGAAKTSEERDWILQDLAARDKAAPAASEMNEAVGAGIPDKVEPGRKRKANLSPGRRSVLVAVMAIVGLFLITPGMMRIMQGQPLGSAADKGFGTGCALLFATAIDVFNRKRLAERGRGKGSVRAEAASGETTGEMQEQVVPGVRVVILLMMATGGLLFIVDAVSTIMKGRYGSFEINFLIVGCAFLFFTVFVFLNERLLARRGQADGGRKRGSVDGEIAGEQAGALRGRVAPEMRVVIIVVLAIAGLGCMVWSMLRVMSSRWDSGDIWILIQSCTLLYFAISFFLKGKRDGDKAVLGD